MIKQRYLLVLTLLISTVLLGAAAMPQPEEKPEFKNLKVLPKNIGHDELRSLMKGWNNALGVKCNFCHAPTKEDPKKLDYASDAKPEKDMARSMYKMTAKINKKYFGHEEVSVPEVSCNTCHGGKEHPSK
jgi:hypothetical protein